MNFMIYAIGMLGFWICGFAFMFGGLGAVGVVDLGGLHPLEPRGRDRRSAATVWGLFGYKGFFLTGATYDVGVVALFLFQMVFMDTTATIPTGAMAERWKFSAFSSTASSSRRSSTRSSATGSGAAAGWPARRQLRPGQRPRRLRRLRRRPLTGGCDRPGRGARSSGRASASTTRTARPTRSPATTCPMVDPGHVHPGLRLVRVQPGQHAGASGNGALRIGIVAVSTMLASGSGRCSAMLYMWTDSASPTRHDGATACSPGWWRSPRRAGFVSPVGGLAHRPDRRRAGRLARPLLREGPQGRRPGRRDHRPRRQRRLGRASRSASSPTAPSNYGGRLGDRPVLRQRRPVRRPGDRRGGVLRLGLRRLATSSSRCSTGSSRLRVSAETELQGLDIPEMGMVGYIPEDLPVGRDLPQGPARDAPLPVTWQARSVSPAMPRPAAFQARMPSGRGGAERGPRTQSCAG